MSGICGVWAIDGDPTARPIDAIIGLLERRGPEGSHVWSDGPVALDHTLLATTPEALVERLPLTDEASACTITADARLDNREELFATLGIDGDARAIGDGELILRAYVRWGDECPAKLLGDFAFAIWDPRNQTIFCARDHMGMRQLIRLRPDRGNPHRRGDARIETAFFDHSRLDHEDSNGLRRRATPSIGT
jgi:asparagine synthase (glutamine-hydrolysing)